MADTPDPEITFPRNVEEEIHEHEEVAREIPVP